MRSLPYSALSLIGSVAAGVNHLPLQLFCSLPEGSAVLHEFRNEVERDDDVGRCWTGWSDIPSAQLTKLKRPYKYLEMYGTAVPPRMATSEILFVLWINMRNTNGSYWSVYTCDDEHFELAGSVGKNNKYIHNGIVRLTDVICSFTFKSDIIANNKNGCLITQFPLHL